MSGATSTVKRVAATTVGSCVKASFGNKTENGSSRLLRSLDELNPALDQPLGFTMCYMTVISTTSEVDLTLLNTPLMQFSRSISGVPEAELLQYPQKWFLGSKDGCSCDFRHLDRGSADLGFSQPVDWWPEDQEDIDATLQVLEVFRSILAGGHDLDCIDA
ncbi:hypothetical protein [Pseudomonas paralcaligenes]|uniref:hypothetical protein n=1 Tax=Pseudomonas paralcaligenes TaxID=2772558 RepID=UPI001C8015B7|nr:hypothetical protein [Pseudomonas paralcaligenes]